MILPRAIENGVFKIIETPPPPAQILVWNWGQGETAVLSSALAYPGWDTVFDDGAARRCAPSLSLMMTGTLAVVLLAKRYGLIDAAAHVLHDLRSADFRLDDKTIRDALERIAGEKWETGR